MKTVYVIAGGTFAPIAPHLALAAPAFGAVGQDLARLMPEARLVLTRMALGGTEREAGAQELLRDAGLSDLRTNDDLEALVDHLVALPETSGIVLAAATCDFRPDQFRKERYSSDQAISLDLEPSPKIIRKIRAARKDIFLVGFKTTAGASADEQYLKGLRLLKTASCNLVLANDLESRRNMVITPEQARYHETTDRQEALTGLAEMIGLRSSLTFTRATVVPGAAVDWNSPLVPDSLRAVVNHCIERGAYKPFLGSTVGHFAVKVAEDTILTSRRKTDFNKLSEVGLVKIVTEGPDSVVAYGSKPSVGGQSQRIIFKEHPEADCIVHFHCPTRPGSLVPVRSQRAFECGSHECGQNTSTGLAPFKTVLAVMLDKHGPNIVFNRSADPNEVIRFIEANFDLEARTDDVAPEAVSTVAMALAMPAFA